MVDIQLNTLIAYGIAISNVRNTNIAPTNGFIPVRNIWCAHTKNYKNAILFLEFLSSENAQEIYTKNIHEYSIRDDVDPSKTILGFGKFIADDSKLQKIGEKIKTAIYLAAKHNWR